MYKTFQYPEAYEQLQREEFGFVSESKRRIYLFCYNLFMFSGFLYAFLIMTIKYSKVKTIILCKHIKWCGGGGGRRGV
jgi:hypothetical protein